MADKNISELLLELIGKVTATSNRLQDAPSAIGTATGKVIGEAVPGKEGEGKRVLKEMMNMLNPMQENVLKTVKKVHAKQVEEAMEAGASGEQVLADAGISISTNQPQPEISEEGIESADPLSVALTGQQPPELFARKGGFLHRPMQVNRGTGEVHPEEILGGLIRAHPDTTAQMLSNILKGQEISGQKPLQKGEMEKIGIQGMIDLQKELAKAGSVDALTPEVAGKFQLLTEGYEATLAIDELLGNNVTATLFAQGVPNFLKSQNAKLLESAIERAVQGRTRIETGAALQPSELKSTSKRFMPKKGDSIDTALRRLKPLYDYFYGAVNIADPTGVHRQRAKGMNAQQVSAKIISFKEIK